MCIGLVYGFHINTNSDELPEGVPNTVNGRNTKRHKRLHFLIASFLKTFKSTHCYEMSRPYENGLILYMRLSR